MRQDQSIFGIRNLPTSLNMGERAIGLRAGMPMRIKVVSDLRDTSPHLDIPCLPEFDVVVAVGNVTGSAIETIRRLRETFPEPVPVVAVLGDREYSGTDRAVTVAKARQVGLACGVVVLEDGHVTVGGVRFAGCTFWSDFRLHGHDVPSIEKAFAAAEETFRKLAIKERHGLMDPWLAAWAHGHNLIALNDALTRPFDGPTVVVTHHAPSGSSLRADQRDDPLAPSMASARDGFVKTCGAALWIHGHVPGPVDHHIGRTRIVASPDEIVTICRTTSPGRTDRHGQHSQAG